MEFDAISIKTVALQTVMTLRVYCQVCGIHIQRIFLGILVHNGHNNPEKRNTSAVKSSIINIKRRNKSV